MNRVSAKLVTLRTFTLSLQVLYTITNNQAIGAYIKTFYMQSYA